MARSAGIGTASDRQKRRSKALEAAGGRAIHVRLQKPAADALALLVANMGRTQEHVLNVLLVKAAERMESPQPKPSWRG